MESLGDRILTELGRLTKIMNILMCKKNEKNWMKCLNFQMENAWYLLLWKVRK